MAHAMAAIRFPAIAALMPRSSSSSSTPEPPSSSSSTPHPSSSSFTSAGSSISGHFVSRAQPFFGLGSRNEDESSPSMAAFYEAVNPTLPYADVLNFRGAYNAQIIVGENESAESVIRRFRRAVMQAGVIAECRRRRFHETPQDIRKRKQQNSRRRRTKGRSNKPIGPGGPGIPGAEKVQEAGWGFEITDEGERWEGDEN